MHIIHKINNLEKLKELLFYFKNNNYAYISYIGGEYGSINIIYKTVVYNFYLKMKTKGIKTVAFTFINMKSFVYDCCDEIIEYQDIEFGDSLSPNLYLGDYTNINGIDGFAPEFYIGSRSKSYETIIRECNFANLFYTLNTDNCYFINNPLTFDENYIMKTHYDILCLYRIEYLNIDLDDIIKITFKNNFIYKKPAIKRDYKNKTRNIGLWIRNTNKHPYSNTLKETYETVFNYCIKNKIYCNVFLDLIPIELPNSIYIINQTKRFKNRPDWDNFIEIINNCDFYIGSKSGSTEFVISNCNVNILYDIDINDWFKNLGFINNKIKEGFICKLLDFTKDFSSILDFYYCNKIIYNYNYYHYFELKK